MGLKVWLLLLVGFLCHTGIAEDSTIDNGNHNGVQNHNNSDTTLTNGHGHSNESKHDAGHHGNNTGDHGGEHGGGHHGIHVASWNFAHVERPFLICIFLVVVAVCKLCFHHANFLSSIFPESCLLIVLGTIVGAILHAAKVDKKDFGDFDSTLFFLYLLPPIILESAYSLHDRVFANNLGTILLYAVVGTLFNCFVIGPTLYGLAKAGAMGSIIPLSLVQCLVFSSLIVAVDPVAVLAIFQEIGVNSVLYFLVFGESLLNDAVTVVLYNMMTAFNKMEDIPMSQIGLGIASFFTISFGGLAIGILYGILTAIITKYTRQVRVVEPLAVFTLAYASYLSAELFHFSGIISIIGCGLVQAQYAFHNIGHKSLTTITYFSKVLSGTSDSIIFLFLGLALVRPDHQWHTGFVLWSILLCLVYRFIGVYLLTFLANKVDRVRIINMEEQFIMAYGGLRGAVAFSLVAMISKNDLPIQPMFQTATLAVIIFTVFVQGITIKPLVKLLRIKRSAANIVSIIEEVNTHVTDHVMSGIEEVVGIHGHNFIRETVDFYDDHYFKHWLQKNPQSKDDDIMDLYQKIALQQHYENVGGPMDDAASIQLQKTYDTPCITDMGKKDPEVMNRAFRVRSKWGKLAEQVREQNKAENCSPENTNSGSLLENVRRLSLTAEEAPIDVKNMSLDQFRKILVPSSETYHMKYDKNLTREDDNDLMHRLYEKQRRAERFRRASTLGSDVGSICSDPAGRLSPTHGLQGIPEDEESNVNGVNTRPYPMRSMTLDENALSDKLKREESGETVPLLTPDQNDKQEPPENNNSRTDEAVSIDMKKFDNGKTENLSDRESNV